MSKRLAIVDYPGHPGKSNDETRWVKWFHHYVLMPNNKKYEWGYIHNREAVGIVAVNEKNEIALVTQYRYPLGERLTEVVKGFVEDGETYEQAAARELAEEVGQIGDRTFLGKTVAAPGIGKIVHHLFLFQNLRPYTLVCDEPHKLDVEWFGLDKFFKLVAKGEIFDEVTITAVVKAKFALGGKL